MADANIPGLGKMPKWAIIATAIGGGLVIFYVVRKQNAAGSAAPQSTQTPDSTATAIDPATGYPYGSPEDQAALSGTGGAGYGYGAGTAGYDYYPTSMDTGSTVTTPSTNQEWSQDAVSMLSQEGYNPETVSGALGVYLSHGRLTANQASLVQQAIALLGQPPQGDYPIVTGGGGGGHGGHATVPNVVGEAAGDAHNAIMRAGLKPVADPGQKASDKVTSTTPKAGATVAPGTRVLITATAAAHEVTVPQTTGMSVGKAHDALVHAGLTPEAPPGHTSNMKVSHTSPRAGSKVPRGTRVTILTSGYVKK